MPPSSSPRRGMPALTQSLRVDGNGMPDLRMISTAVRTLSW
ncbi:MAG TPA: hypothetical protein VGN04_01635 [Herbaspirillum sp.]